MRAVVWHGIEDVRVDDVAPRIPEPTHCAGVRLSVHRWVVPLTEAPRAYELFQKKRDGCVKVVPAP